MAPKKYDILNGNELIVQGALEAGFSLYTGYPGSPLADYFNILFEKRKLLEEYGIKVVIANSEANGAAMASGAKQAGRDCLVAMKSMGLHVASDALSVGNFANPGPVTKDPETGEKIYPGVVIVVGDDPWSISTSTPADSRYLYKHLHIPFLAPSTPQELKDWMGLALEISKKTSVYQGILTTTFMAEGGGRVEVHPLKKISKNLEHLNPNDFDLSKNVMVPPNSLKADVGMINERFPKVEKVLKELSLDKISGNLQSKIGLISSGEAYETLRHVLLENNLLEVISLYKLAAPYPLVRDLLLPWLKNLKHCIVVEEKRGFIEQELAELIQSEGLKLKIFGKKFGEREGFPAHGGLSFDLINQKLGDILSELGSKACSYSADSVDISGSLPKRLPTFCPGCPHRETLSLLKEIRRELDREGIHLLSHGDVGCYSLSFLPPFKEMHNLSAMGQGGALGAGVDLFTSNPSVVLMGDSTFFHSGMTDISNSLQCGHDITYILLDNDNTAMTGHQVTPRTGLSVDGHQRPRQDMLNLVKSLGVGEALEISPSDRYFYRNILVDYVKKPGVKVIVSNKECALTFHGRLKAKERKELAQGRPLQKKSFYQINTDLCEDCRVCVDMTGCPGLGQTFDAYGTKVMIDPQICVADSYCTKMKACPSFEKVDVFNYHPTLYKEKKSDLNHDAHENLPTPDPLKTFEDIRSGGDLKMVVTGVGGSGVTTISRVLSKAAQKMGGVEGVDFKFVDQKGLAQRNGNVTAHLCLFPQGKSSAPITPKGSADLLLSPDLLDGSQHLKFLGPSGEAIFDRDFQIPLSLILDRGEEREPLTAKKLEERLKEKLGDKIQTIPLKEICSEVLGKGVYASAMILGAAFQMGRFPFSLTDLKEAFEASVPKSEFDNNWRAFGLGREWVVRGEEFMLATYLSYTPVKEAFEREKRNYILSLRQSLLPIHSKKALVQFFTRDAKMLERFFPEINPTYLWRYMHDIYVYDRGGDLDNFWPIASDIRDRLKSVKEKEIALRALVKTFFIKDEVFVSHIMLSPMQKKRDQERYAKLGTKYKKHPINRPSFSVLGKKIEFDLSPAPWMLKIMRHLRLLRLILPGWHQEEKKIALKIREELRQSLGERWTEEKRYQFLMRLDNIKGYREVRQEMAHKRGL